MSKQLSLYPCYCRTEGRGYFEESFTSDEMKKFEYWKNKEHKHQIRIVHKCNKKIYYHCCKCDMKFEQNIKDIL